MNPSAIPAAPAPTAAPNNDAAQFGEYADWAAKQMANGHTADELRQFAAQNGVDLNQGPTPAAGPQPNELEKLLPTAGGVVGGLVGSIGDLAGPLGLATTTLGASAGGALGQALENALTGKKVIEGNDLSSAVENGVGNLAGAGIAKAGGAILGGATKLIGGKVAATEAATAASTDAANVAAQQAAKEAEIKRLGDEFNVGPGQGDLASRTRGVVDNLTTLGIEQPMAGDAVKVGNVITGSNDNGMGIINQAKQQVLQDAGGTVNIGQIGDATSPSGKLLAQLRDPSVQAQLGDPLNPNDTNKTASLILNKYDQLANGAGVPAEGAGTITPAAGFKLLTNVQNEARAASQAAGKVNALPADQAKADIWNQLVGNLKDALYNRDEVHSAVAGFKVTPELSSQIDAKIAAEGITDPKVAATLKQSIEDTLNNGSNMQDWLSVEHDGVDMHKVGNAALKQQGNLSSASTQRLAKTASAPIEPDMAPATDKNGKSWLDMAAMAGIPLTHGMSAIGLLPHMLSLAKDPAAQKAALDTLGKVTSNTVAQKAVPALVRSGAIMSANAPNIASGSAIPTNGAVGSGAPGMNPGVQNPTQEAVNAALLALQQPGGLMSSAGGNAVSVLNSLAPAATSQDLASASGAHLSSAYGAAGGASGPAGGLVNELIAKLVPGSAPAVYDAQKMAMAAQIAKLTGVPIETVLKSLPSMMSTPETASPAQGYQSSLLNTLTGPQPAAAQ